MAEPTVTAAQVLITNAARAQVNGGKMSDEDIDLALSYAKAEYPGLYEKVSEQLRTEAILTAPDVPATYPGAPVNAEG